MKKTFIFGLIAAALGFTACSSEDDLMVNNQNTHKGMVLRATVEQTVGTRATFTDAEGEEGVWQFAFAVGDNVSVTNNDIVPDFYTFTNEGTEFKCEDAKAAEGPVAWYAYFPSNEVSLVGQSGTKADVANKYALAGATASATTGEEGLNITMSPKVAILVINNQIGEININVKNGASTWVSGLTANADGFNVTTSTTKQNLLSATETGTYYIAVPAGVQLAVKDGDKTIKSTGTSGLTAGKYYNLTIEKPFPEGSRGKAYATTPNCDVNWVQLWEGGPKFAEYNVGATSASESGGLYCWGKTIDKDENRAHKSGGSLSGADDTATNLWGENWRMPTNEELQSLLDNCDVEAIKDPNDEEKILGKKFIGKGDYASNSVFLPAAGRFYLIGLEDLHYDGYYWSSMSKSKFGGTYYLSFSAFEQSMETFGGDCGFSVRAVLK